MLKTSTRYEIRPISVEELSTIAEPLFRRNQAEQEPWEKAPLAPMWGAYENMDRAGSLVALGGFCDERIVAYATAAVLPHLHYGYLYGLHDALYVTPDHRDEALGIRMIRAVEASCKQKGATQMVWHAKDGSALAAIMDHRADLEELVYRRAL